ncbi:MAG: hypothetical protein M2R45_00990 [Verrucomicrobia subdivision 3 bacterium]|nr:hypothetical protein [Limisphaerales bacterium]MCS1414100.1 hypothetical protein [Limisphaerales bacterium]
MTYDQGTFYIIHVLAIIILSGLTFVAFANPVEAQRRKVLMASGISSLLAVIAGFGLSGSFKYGFPGWMIVKLVCWLGLSVMAGIAYRKPQKIPALAGITIALLIIALYMVYFQRFSGVGTN